MKNLFLLIILMLLPMLAWSQELIPFEDSTSKLFGYKDKTGKVVIPCKWYSARAFYEGRAVVMNNNKLWGYIDETGKEVVPCQWKRGDNFSEGMALVWGTNDKWGYIDKTGKEVIPCKWSWIRKFLEGLAAVQDSNKKWGYIDKTGKEVISCQWDEVGDFTKGMAWVMNKGADGLNWRYGCIDKTGKLVIPCQWHSQIIFSEDMAAVRGENDYWGYIDKTGKLVIPCQWKEQESSTFLLLTFLPSTPPVKHFSDGLAAVEDANGYWGYIDKTGKLVIPYVCLEAGSFKNGRARVSTNEFKSGITIDKTCNLFASDSPTADYEQYMLGQEYYFGKNGRTQDYVEAAKWFKKSAEQGYAMAQFSLGYCYSAGVGVPKDKAEGKMWLQKAADQGLTAAKEMLEQLK